jgi:hypothetical protein
MTDPSGRWERSTVTIWVAWYAGQSLKSGGNGFEYGHSSGGLTGPRRGEGDFGKPPWTGKQRKFLYSSLIPTFGKLII